MILNGVRVSRCLSGRRHWGRAAIEGNSVPGRGKSKCKRPGVSKCPGVWGTEWVSVAGVEGLEGDLEGACPGVLSGRGLWQDPPTCVWRRGCRVGGWMQRGQREEGQGQCLGQQGGSRESLEVAE